jgi:hypothetical protein
MPPVVDETGWATQVAARLKLLQANCADDPPAKKQEYFTEEIDRALAEIPPGQRTAYLRALALKFPAWDGAGSAPLPVGGPAVSSSASPEVLLERLLQAVPQLSEETKGEFTRKLAEAGLVKVEKTGGKFEMPEELQKKLGLTPGQPIRPERTFRLLVLISQEMLKLDSLAWETWSKLAPRSPFRKDARGTTELKVAIEKYLSSDSEESSLQMHQFIEKTRKLIAGLVGAIPVGGKKFAEEFLVRFLPKNIEDIVGARGGGLFGDSIEKRCWNKYKELAYPDSDSIEKKLKDAIAKQAEEMVTKG